jgi:hypothetical protein
VSQINANAKLITFLTQHHCYAFFRDQMVLHVHNLTLVEVILALAVNQMFVNAMVLNNFGTPVNASIILVILRVFVQIVVNVLVILI